MLGRSLQYFLHVPVVDALQKLIIWSVVFAWLLF